MFKKSYERLPLMRPLLHSALLHFSCSLSSLTVCVRGEGNNINKKNNVAYIKSEVECFYNKCVILSN